MSCYSSSLKGSLCSFEHTGIHNHNNVADITKTMIKDVLKNAAAKFNKPGES